MQEESRKSNTSSKSETMADTPPAHFFKVILPQTLEDKNLWIPEKFVRKFRDELSDVAMLRVPNGRVWQVGMTKAEGKICFNGGWHDFIKHHSICVGYFLVFKYGGNSIFDVLILDTTYCEIQYPYNGENSNKQKSPLQHEIKTEDSVEKMDSRTPNPPPLNKRTRPCFGSAAPVTRRKRAAALKKNEADAVADKQESVMLEEMGIFINKKFPGYSAEERRRVINIAKSLKPKTPSFMIILRSAVLAKRTVYVPLEFADKYLSRDAKLIKLRVHGGREWPVTVTWGQCGGGPSMRFKWKTWDRFSKEKKLEEGDICMFELIRKKSVLLKVSVFPCTKSK